MSIKKTLTLLLTFCLITGYVKFPQPVHAASLSYTDSINWTELTCTGILNSQNGVNGVPTQTLGMLSGDTLNLTLNNMNSSKQIDLIFDVASGITPDFNSIAIPPSGSETISFTMTAGQNYTLGWYTSPTSCNPQAGNEATINIAVASGSMSCSLSDGQWNVTGSYENGGYITTSLYNGSTIETGVINQGRGTLSGIWPAGTSPSTFYLYNGPDSTGELIAQTTCDPPVVIAPVSTPSSDSSKGDTTPTIAATTNTATTTVKTTPTAKSNAAKNITLSIKAAKTSARFGINKILIILIILIIGIVAYIIYRTKHHIKKKTSSKSAKKS